MNNLEKNNIELRNDLIDTRTNLNKKLEGIFIWFLENISIFSVTINLYKILQKNIKLKFNYCNWIAATTELLTTTVNNLDKTNIELRNAKSDFNKRLKGIYNNDLRIDEN